eukprot:3709-Eustigmatos_ZCMA.PRE.1
MSTDTVRPAYEAGRTDGMLVTNKGSDSLLRFCGSRLEIASSMYDFDATAGGGTHLMHSSQHFRHGKILVHGICATEAVSGRATHFAAVKLEAWQGH